VGVATGLCCSLHRVSCMPRLKLVGAAGTRSGKESGKERVGEGETEKKGDGRRFAKLFEDSRRLSLPRCRLPMLLARQ